jgi:hypothetical protein
LAHQNEFIKIFKGAIFNHNYLSYDYRDYLLRNEFYDDFWAHILIPTVFCFVLSSYLAYKLIYVSGGLDRKSHVSGPLLLVNKIAIKNARKKLRKQIRKGDNKSFLIHPKVRLGLKNFVGNTFLIGSIGSGKTNIILSFLSQLVEENCKALIYDAKPEFVQKFANDHCVGIINPKDMRSLRWSLQKDIASVQDSKSISEAFIAEDKKDPFWTSGARLILTGIIESIRHTHEVWGWREISSYLLKDIEELKEIFSRHYPQAQNLLEKESKTTQSFIMVLTNQLDWLHEVAREWPDSNKNKFSVGEWILGNREVKQLIVPNYSSNSAISAPLCSAIISMSVKYVMSRKATSDQVWFVLDELANIPKTEALKQWLTMARSKGGRTIAGSQDYSQLESIYGNQDAKTIFSQFSNFVCLRINSHESASKIAKQFGQRTVSKKTESFDHEGRKSRSYTSELENLIPEQYLMNLPVPDKKGFWGFLSVNGWTNTYLLKWPYPNAEDVTPELVPKKYSNIKDTSQPKRGSRGRASRC